MMSDYDKESRQYAKQCHKDFLENIDDRPFLMWVAIVDNRTCELCRDRQARQGARS